MTDDESFRGGRLNPLNWISGRGSRYRYRDPDAPSAREVHDPHTWDDPDPSFRERVTPDTLAGWLAAGMFVLIGGGLALYLVPIFAPTFRNPWFLGVCLVIAYSVGLILYGRKTGFRAYKNLAKSIIYYGEDIDVRVGRDAGTDGRSKLFIPYRNLGFAGLSSRPLQKRDLPYSATKLRSNLGDDGTDPVVDRLNQTTRTVETDTIGRVHVTWAEDLDYDAFARESDRYTTRPKRMDEGVARDMNELIGSLETAITTLRQQKSMLEERSSELRNTRQEAVIPELEQTIELMKQMYEFQPDQKQPSNAALTNGSSRARNRPNVSDQIWREVEEELEDR